MLASDVSPSVKLLLMVLAHYMSDTGKVTMRRERLAALLDVHPQRVAERIAVARKARLLDLVGGTGVRGRVAQYVAVVPSSRASCVPMTGTHEDGFVTGNRYAQIGTHFPGHSGQCVPVSGTHNTRALRNATSEPNFSDRDFGTRNATKLRIEERAPAQLLVADLSRWAQLAYAPIKGSAA